MNMLADLLNVLYPPVCCGCRNLLLTGEHTICTKCRHELALTNYHLYAQTEAASKFSGRLELAFISCFVYFSKSSIAQKLIHELKYKGQQQIGELFAHWYAADLKQITTLQNIDYVIPVPLHKRRLRERGYNQVALFAKTLASSFGAQYNDNLLIRKQYRKTLTTLFTHRRRANNRQYAYAMRQSPAENSRYSIEYRNDGNVCLKTEFDLEIASAFF